MGNHLLEFIRAEKLRETCVNIINISVIALGESWQKKFIPWLNNAFRIRKRIHVKLFSMFFVACEQEGGACGEGPLRSIDTMPASVESKYTNYKFKFAIIVSAFRRVVCIIFRLVIPPTMQISVRHFFGNSKLAHWIAKQKPRDFQKPPKHGASFVGDTWRGNVMKIKSNQRLMPRIASQGKAYCSTAN